ncbi:hypothetical protein ANO14919_077900 [Xylariales sp. No.14919]|nr:hypothetical protein ANO14919_077900 [Xylariales sp. No.14919]
MPRQTRSQAKKLGGRRAENPIEPRTTRQPRTRGSQQRTVKTPGISVTKRRANKQAKRRSVKTAVDVTERRRVTFNSLPVEIRLMIWEEFVRAPRIIHIDVLDDDFGKKRGFVAKFKWPNKNYFTDCEQVCPLLGVNHESRSVALKEPLIDFEIHYPVTWPKRFGQTHLFRHFAIRRHDIVFFENSNASVWSKVSGVGRSVEISNVMIDLDIMSLDYQDWYARPHWGKLFMEASKIIQTLRNKEKLENFYCLMRRSTSKQHQRFEPDDFCDPAPGSFRGKRLDIERWLAEFQGFPADDYIALIGDYERYYPTLRTLWRNVAIKR